jgi:SPP1 gp7 family putative phage head morphogenesis protein
VKQQARGSLFRDRLIQHDVYLQRYSASVVRRMLALLVRTDEDLVARIRTLDPDAAKRVALERVLENIRTQQQELAGELKTRLSKELTAFGAYEAETVGKLASATFGVKFEGPTLEMVRAAALARPFAGVHLRFAKLDEHMDELGVRRGQLIRDTVRRGFLEGLSIDDIVRDLRGTRAQNYKDGLLETSRRTTEAIVRTAINHTANAAREEVYKANDSLIKGVKWISVIDARTSAVCRARDDEIFPVDSGPRPPAHPNCRSTTVAVLRGEDPPSRTSYAGWLRTLERDDVEDILGKRKAALFLDGGLKLERFVDASGKEYTLEQLRAREAKAWARAKLDGFDA